MARMIVNAESSAIELDSCRIVLYFVLLKNSSALADANHRIQLCVWDRGGRLTKQNKSPSSRQTELESRQGSDMTNIISSSVQDRAYYVHQYVKYS